VDILRDNKIPQYGVPERAAKALLEMVNYSNYRKRPARKVDAFDVDKKVVADIIADYRKRGVHEIGEVDAKAAMRAYKFNVPSGKLAKTAKEAGQFTEEMGYPVVMKISSPDILHKSDAGGVKVGLKNRAEVEEAFEKMMVTVKERVPKADIKGVLLEKMIGGKDEQEVLIGMSKDPQFGPVIMFGWGGIYVEVLKDVCQKLAPLTADEAMAMIQGTKVYKMLKGARGAKPSDIKAVVENLQRISQLVTDFEDIAEIDINPLKVGLEGTGATLLDARIILTR
ncbi:MAG: acetate--CoA ligase family protein, partial [Chitinispirillales bacterium]|jgi:acetyltransferase|nr:acetate--CoA ligase family protein [Chitinispirillales bacterium]